MQQSLLSVSVQAQVIQYHVEPQALDTALIEFAEEAKLSISFPALDLSILKSQGTKGHISKEASLRSILAGSGLAFRFITKNTLQIYKPKIKPSPNSAKSVKTILLDDRSSYVEDLVVTATKRPETNFGLPVSISGVSSLVLEDLSSYDFQSLAPHLAGVSTTNLGPGRNKIFVRGLSDGPFADRTQAVVGVYLDETPINFSDTNPDIRLFDVERVELVRGPQGTLYGAGSLGGLYRIISTKPDLQETEGKVRLSTSHTKTGGINGVVDAVFNTPIINDKLGFRVSGYADIRDGYIDNITLNEDDTNDLNIYGIRPSLRWKVNERWTLDTSINIQSIRYEDSQYYFRELERNQRDSFIPEPYEDDFIHASLTLKGKIGDVNITSATAYVDRTITETQDATRGLPFLNDLQAASGAGSILQASDLEQFGVDADFSDFFDFDAIGYFSRDDINTLSHETRLQSETGNRFDWLLGAYLLNRKQTTANLLVLGSADTNRDPEIALTEGREETAKDIALFGEATYHFTDKLSLTGGLRFSYSNIKVDYTAVFALDINLLNINTNLSTTDGPSFILNGNALSLEHENSTTKLIPKLALRYAWSDNIQTYAQISVGYRVGGININTPVAALIASEPEEDTRHQPDSRTFQSDELINYEIGVKSFLFDRRLSLNIAGFYVTWFDIQSDQINSSGFPFVTNVGQARTYGYEVELSARLFEGFEMRGSFFWNDSELTAGNSFLNANAGDRLPTIPENTASLSFIYQFDVSQNWLATISADYAYTGSSALTFDEENSPQMEAYGIINSRIQFADDKWKFGIFAQNLADSQANTFAFGNNFTITQGNQITPPRPRTIGLFIERSF